MMIADSVATSQNDGAIANKKINAMMAKIAAPTERIDVKKI